MYAVIMAGGQGTRLWPKSRKNNPKQLHALIGESSLVRETFDRLLLITTVDKIIISTTPEYLVEIKKQLPKLPDENFIIEPYPMNTAAACGLVSKILFLRDSESTVLFSPSDHNIKDSKTFASTLRYAEETCQKYPRHIFTIGIKPTKPDTGLGYIQVGSIFNKSGNFSTYKVAKFVEKPDQKTAEKYVASGKYYWNAGMFIWKTEYILELFKKDLPQTNRALDKIAEHYGKADYSNILDMDYKDVENISIDYGIMEKNRDILVIPADIGWSDIGSWGTMLEVLSEVEGSDVISRGNHISVGDSNVLVMGSDKLIATVGLKDIVIVDSADALLVCDGKVAHKVKDVIDKLKQQNKQEYL